MAGIIMKCEHNDSRIINSRHHNSVDKVRRHKCKICDARWTTVEIEVTGKVDNIRQDIACEYMGVSPQQVEAVVFLLKTLRQM